MMKNILLLKRYGKIEEKVVDILKTVDTYGLQYLKKLLIGGCPKNMLAISTNHPFDMVKKLQDIPSGYVKIAIENGHRRSGFSH